MYLACAVFGGLLLLLQLVGGFVGADDGHHGHGVLQLPSLRVLAAALAGFGLAGMGVRATGASPGLVAMSAVTVALIAGVAVAALTRLLLRFERDGTVRLSGAVGRPATVYVPIPPAGAGVGKVQLALQGRVVEAAAVSGEPAALATGAPVVVVDVTDGATLVVVPDPSASGVLP
ncbi:NfeD family protein [Roseisolibacter sp. H3M3-2]|nr:NfeD family protein [Roseisolibacter sp. H3M3-2]